MDILKSSILALCLLAPFSANALYCGKHIVDEGTMITNAIDWCGEPTARFQNSYFWKNLNGTNMSYSIHFDNFGAITSIDEQMEF